MPIKHTLRRQVRYRIIIVHDSEIIWKISILIIGEVLVANPGLPQRVNLNVWILVPFLLLESRGG